LESLAGAALAAKARNDIVGTPLLPGGPVIPIVAKSAATLAKETRGASDVINPLTGNPEVRPFKESPRRRERLSDSTAGRTASENSCFRARTG